MHVHANKVNHCACIVLFSKYDIYAQNEMFRITYIGKARQTFRCTWEIACYLSKYIYTNIKIFRYTSCHLDKYQDI